MTTKATKPQRLNNILPSRVLRDLRKNFNRTEMNNQLEQLFKVYGVTNKYIEDIRKVFYDRHQPRVAPNSLTVSDRERCLIALLASRGGQFPLAVHLYLGLMEGLSPEEIANILFLTGIYTGQDNLALGLFTLETTLATLKGIGAQRPSTQQGKKLRVSARAAEGARDPKETKDPKGPKKPKAVLEALMVQFGVVKVPATAAPKT